MFCDIAILISFKTNLISIEKLLTKGRYTIYLSCSLVTSVRFKFNGIQYEELVTSVAVERWRLMASEYTGNTLDVLFSYRILSLRDSLVEVLWCVKNKH